MFLNYLFLDKYRLILEKFGVIILNGIGITLLLSLLGTIFGFMIALILSVLRIQKINKADKMIIRVLKKIGSGFAKIYVTVFRGTPMIVQAVIFYYFFNSIGIRWSPIQAGLFTVSVNTAAYLAEILRGAIVNLDKGQAEAAKSLGMSKFKMMIFIIFPQAIKNSMAPICNELVVNIKDTAVLTVISVADLYSATSSAAGYYYWYIEAMLLAAGIYLILTYSTSRLLVIIEKRLGVPKMSIPNNTEVLS